MIKQEVNSNQIAEQIVEQKVIDNPIVEQIVEQKVINNPIVAKYIQEAIQKIKDIQKQSNEKNKINKDN